MSSIDDSDLEHISRIIHDDAGIVIDAGKNYLVQDRLESVARNVGLDSVKSLVRELRGPRGRALRESVVDAMTTNETFFFRDEVPFRTLGEQVLPWLARTRASQKRISLWCAAASTGQEPYSLAMTFLESACGATGWNLDQLATDISTTALERARIGRYTDFEVGRGLDEARRARYFERDGRFWVARPELKRLVDFKRFNLLHAQSQEGPFDLIFVRNVLIYFDVPTKAKILRAMSRALAPDGLLVLGAGESILQLDVNLVRVATLPGAYYARPGHPLA